MALMTIKKVAPGVKLGLWRIEESIDDFHIPQREWVFSRFKNESRRLQKLSIYALLGKMTEDNDLIVSHTPSGKPELEGWHISISDTRGYVAVILSRCQRVAVDIEYVANRVNRVASKFIRTDEIATSTMTRLIHWSAKETAFKYYSEQSLQYFEMRLLPFSMQTSGIVNVENLKNGGSLRVHYCQNEAFVLTYAY